ncbi:MAG: hypothetical protein U1F43_19145 [Myxococcota bacterium]
MAAPTPSAKRLAPPTTQRRAERFAGFGVFVGLGARVACGPRGFLPTCAGFAACAGAHSGAPSGS